MSTHRIICGHVLDVLRDVPNGYVDMLMTSVPYWGLRDYGKDTATDWGDWHGQLGLEPTPELYIEHLRMVFAEVIRVLKPMSTCWVNIGDSFASGKSRYNSSPHTLSGKGRDEPMTWNKPDLYKYGY